MKAIKLFRIAGIQVYLSWWWFLLAIYEVQARRLIRPIQQHSKEFATVDLDKISGELFKGVEDRIYADAMAVASNPAALCGPGELRAVMHTDNTGRQITEFFGDPRSWMDDFASPVQKFIRRINTKPQSGD